MESIWFFDQLVDILVPGERTGGRFSLCEVRVPPGSGAPLHVHRREEEGFYVIEGEMTIWAGEDETVLHAGDFLEAPRDVPHTFENTGTEQLRCLITASPAGFENFVRAYGTAATAHELPVMDGPPDPARVAAVAAEHGIEILGPPGMRPAELAGDAASA